MQESDSSSEVALVLADGRKVLKSGQVIKEVEVPQPAAQVHREIESGRAASRTLERMHRKLGDLPDIPQKMNPIAAILVYNAIGLSNDDIATALGASTAQIETIKSSDPYKQLSDMFDKTIFEDAKRNAKHIVAKASDKAAQRIVDFIDSKDSLISLSASKEIARLGGISLADEHVRPISGLKIVIEKSDGAQKDEVTVTLGE